MNEKVLQDLYNRAVSKGYGKSQDEFVSLIQGNQKVLEDNYKYVQTKGYSKSQEDFASLVGFNSDPEKKNQIPIGIAEPSESSATPLPSPSVEQLKQESFYEYLNDAATEGYVSEEEVSNPPEDILSVVAERKFQDPKTQTQEGITYSWGPKGFGQEGETKEDIDNRVRGRIINEENNKITDKLKGKLLSTIPEGERTSENITKLEEKLWQEDGVLLNLNPEEGSRIGEDKSGGFFIAAQKGVEDVVLSTMANIQEAKEAVGIPSAIPTLGMNLPSAKKMGEIRDEELDRLTKKMTQYDGDILDNLTNGEFEAAFDLTLQQTGESLPLMIAASGGGGVASLASLTGLSASKHYQDVKNEDFFKELSPAAKAGYLAAYGGSEGFDLMVGGRILKRAARAGATGSQAAKKTIGDFFKGYGYDVGQEGVTEGATGVAQYVADMAAKGQDITFEGIEDAFIRSAVGGIGGGMVMSGSARGLGATRAVLNSPELLKIRNKKKDVEQALRQAETKQEVQILSAELDKIDEVKNNLAKQGRKKFNRMSEEDQTNYARAVANFNVYREQISKIPEDSKAREIAEETAKGFIDEISALNEKYEQPVQQNEAFSETEQDVDSEQDTQQPTNQEDAIQERETFEVPSESETQPVQEVEGEVRGEQEGEAGTQERGTETENQKEVVLKYEPKETPKQFSDLEGGARVFKEAAGVYNKALDRRQGEQVSLEDAVSYIQGTKAYENANDTQREQMVRAFRKEVGEREKLAPSVSKLQGKQKPPTKGYTNTQITRLAEKIDARGIKEGKRLGRIKEAEFTEAVKEILSDIPKGQMSASQAAILSKRAKSVRTPYQLKKFLQYADRVMNDAEYATDIKKAESLLSKIKTLSKQKNKPSNITSFAKEFSSIDPNKVPDIKQYLTYAERVLNLDRKPKVTKNGFEEPSMYVSIDEIRSEYLNRYKEMSENDLKESILSDYQDLVDQKGNKILDKSMSVDELNSIIDSIYSEEEFSLNDDQKRNTLKKLVDYKIIEVSDMSTENLSVKAKEQIEFIKKADLDGLNLSDKQLASLYASLENYIYNGSLNNIASVTSTIYAAEAHKELNDYFNKTGNSPREWVSKWKNLALGSLAMTQVLEALRGSTKSGSLVYEKSGLYEMSANKTKAENRVSEKTSEYTKLFVDRSNKKIVEAVTNMGDRADRMIYGFLSQVPQSDFKDAIDYVEQSIDYQINDTNSNVSELAKEAKKVFDKKYKNANSISEIDISKENLSIIDWFRGVFKEIQPEYFENAEIVHNRTLELTDNYLPFVSRAKDETSKTEDTLEQPSSLLDKVILPNRSGATNKRRNVFNSNTRYMPLDFEANMFSQYTNQVMDIETAFTIKKIASFLRSPNSVEVFGDRGMQKAFFERAKEYVNQSYESNNMGATENAVFKVFNYAANISGRVALGGVDQSFKQFVPVVLNASINAGPENMMLGMKALVDGSAKDLISNTPVSRRAYTDQDTKRIYSKIPEAERKLFINKLKNIVRVTDRNAEQIMMYVIQNSDKVGAQASFLAYYKDFLGEDFKGFEQEGKNPNKEALAFADLMINNTQNVNDIDQQARWLRVKNKDFTSLTRKVLFPFISFRINQIGDQVIQVSKAKNKKERVDAAKRLGGRIAEQLAFEAIRKGIYAAYGAAAGGILYALTGIEGEEDDKKDEKFLSEKNMYSVGTATLLNQMPFYGLAGTTDNIMNESVNKYYFYHVLDPKEREKYTGYISPRLDEMDIQKKLRRGYEKYKRNSKQPLFVERPDPTGIDLGALSIGAENHFSGAQAMWDIYHPIISGNDFVYTSKSGNKTELDLSDEEKKALAIFAIMENTDLFLPNDIAKVATKAKRKLFTKKFREIYGD